MSRAEPAATIDPADTVVVFANLQPELAHESRTPSEDAIEAGAEALARAAELLGLLMLFSPIPVDGKPPRHLPALADHANDRNRFTRRVGRPFGGAACVPAIETTGCNILVLAGYSSEALLGSWPSTG